MEGFSNRVLLAFYAVAVLLPSLQQVVGISFILDTEECFSHSVAYEGDTVHASFVIVKGDVLTWHFGEGGVDLVVKGSSGDEIHNSREKLSDMFNFEVTKKGLHSFCFTNKSPHPETLHFDVHTTRSPSIVQHAKQEHFNPLFDQIGKLEEILHNIQFEQHWLEAETQRQAVVNKGMEKRAIQKALLESAALIGASVLQFYLLRQLFERKLKTSVV